MTSISLIFYGLTTCLWNLRLSFLIKNVIPFFEFQKAIYFNHKEYRPYSFYLQVDDEEEGKEKIPLVKEEPRGRRQPQKQGSAIDLDIGPPLEPNQVRWSGRTALNNKMLHYAIDVLLIWHPFSMLVPYLLVRPHNRLNYCLSGSQL